MMEDVKMQKGQENGRCTVCGKRDNLEQAKKWQVEVWLCNAFSK